MLRLGICLLSITLLFLSACSTKSDYTIDGIIAGGNFDGEKMYLVPFEGANAQTVDSCIITHSQFHFEGKTRKPEACIIRPNYRLRINMQEVLVFKEGGQIVVSLSKSSMVSGTPNNDLLQNWKEAKEKLDKQIYKIRIRLADADSLEDISLHQQLDSIKNTANNYHYQFALQHKDLAAGQFVAQLFKPVFSTEQLESLELN